MESGYRVLAMMAMMASPAMASCAYGTLLQPRQEDGTVEVNTFGYNGPTVSVIKLDYTWHVVEVPTTCVFRAV